MLGFPEKFVGTGSVCISVLQASNFAVRLKFMF